MKNSNCCSPNQDSNSNCCTTPTPVKDNSKKDMKKKIGMFLMGLALVFAISSAFKIATNSSDEFSLLPPSIEDFEWMETDKKVAYVLLKGEEKEQNKLLATQINKVVQELNGSDGSAEYYKLNSTHQHYESFIEKTGVETIPSVVVLGRGGNLSLLPSESVNSIKLLRAYVSATTPAVSCNPAACSPSKTCTPAQKAKCGTKKVN